MTIANPTNAFEIADRFAETIRSEPAVRTLWFRQWGMVAELWLVTEPIEIESERRLRRISRQLYRQFPKALIDFQILNPRLLGDSDPESLIPADAESRHLH